MRGLVAGLAVAAAACGAAQHPAAGAAKQELHEVGELIAAGKYDEAEARLAVDRDRFAADAHAEDTVAYLGAMVDAWRRDYAAAGTLIEGRIAAAAARHDADDEWSQWNTLTWIRWAGGDLAEAIEANENLLRLAQTMKPADAIAPLGHYWWDRAYLQIDLAYRSAPPDAAALARADDARRHYVTDVVPAFEDKNPTPDPVHVINCYAAQRAGDHATATREADQVSEEWPDLQDAYVMMRAYELAGQTQKAEALKQKIQKGNYIMVPIYLQQMERDHQ